MLQVTVARKDFGAALERRTQIADVQLSVAPGRTLALIGPSGSGKTTLLRIIAGIDSDYVGAVSLGGSPVIAPSRGIQFVFQDSWLLPWKSVIGNLTFVADNPTAREEANVVLGKMGLAGKASAWPKVLSGGERSRVALARALVTPPSVLLLDEPFRNLDIVTKWGIQDTVIDFIGYHQIRCVFVSHSILDAVMMSDEILVLSRPPMGIIARIPVDLPQPRDRRDHQVASIVDRVTASLEGVPQA